MDEAPSYGEVLLGVLSPYRLMVRTLPLHGRDWSSILHMDKALLLQSKKIELKSFAQLFLKVE